MSEDQQSHEAYINNPEFPFQNLNIEKFDKMRKSFSKGKKKTHKLSEDKASVFKALTKQGNNQKLQKGLSRSLSKSKNFITKNIESIVNLTKKKEQFIKSKKACNRSHIVGYDFEKGNDKKNLIKAKENDFPKWIKTSAVSQGIKNKCASVQKGQIIKDTAVRSVSERKTPLPRDAKLRNFSEIKNKNLINDMRNKSKCAQLDYKKFQSTKIESEKPFSPNTAGAFLKNYKSFTKDTVVNKTALTEPAILESRQNVKEHAKQGSDSKKKQAKENTLNLFSRNVKPTETSKNEIMFENEKAIINGSIYVSPDKQKKYEIEKGKLIPLTTLEEKKRKSDHDEILINKRKLNEEKKQNDTCHDIAPVDSNDEFQQKKGIIENEKQEDYDVKQSIVGSEDKQKIHQMKASVPNDESKEHKSFSNIYQGINENLDEEIGEKNKVGLHASISLTENKKLLLEGLKTFSSMKSLYSLNTLNNTNSLKKMDMLKSESLPRNVNNVSFFSTINKTGACSPKTLTPHNTLQYKENTSFQTTEEIPVNNQKENQHIFSNNMNLINKNKSVDQVLFQPVSKKYKHSSSDHMVFHPILNKEKITSLKQLSFDKISQTSGSQCFNYIVDDKHEKFNLKNENPSFSSGPTVENKSISLKAEGNIYIDENLDKTSQTMNTFKRNIINDNTSKVVFNENGNELMEDLQQLQNTQGNEREHITHLEKEIYNEKVKDNLVNGEYNEYHKKISIIKDKEKWNYLNGNNVKEDKLESEKLCSRKEEGPKNNESKETNKKSKEKEQQNEILQEKNSYQQKESTDRNMKKRMSNDIALDFLDTENEKQNLLEKKNINLNEKVNNNLQKSNTYENDSCIGEINHCIEQKMNLSEQEGKGKEVRIIEKGERLGIEKEIELNSSNDTYNTEILNMYKKKLSNTTLEGEKPEKIINKKLIMQELFGSNYEPSLVNLGESNEKIENKQIEEHAGKIDEIREEEHKKLIDKMIEVKHDGKKSDEKEEIEEEREEEEQEEEGQEEEEQEEEGQEEEQQEEGKEEEQQQKEEGQEEEEQEEEGQEEEGQEEEEQEEKEEVDEDEDKKESEKEKEKESESEKEKEKESEEEKEKEKGNKKEMVNVDLKGEEYEEIDDDENMSSLQNSFQPKDNFPNKKTTKEKEKNLIEYSLNKNHNLSSFTDRSRLKSIDSNANNARGINDDESLMNKSDEDSSPLILSKPSFEELESNKKNFKTFPNISEQLGVSHLTNEDDVFNRKSINGTLYQVPILEELVNSDIEMDNFKKDKVNSKIKYGISIEETEKHLPNFMKIDDRLKNSTLLKEHLEIDQEISSQEKEYNKKEGNEKNIAKEKAKENLREREKETQCDIDEKGKTRPSVVLEEAISQIRKGFSFHMESLETQNETPPNALNKILFDKNSGNMRKCISSDYAYKGISECAMKLNVKEKNTCIYNEHNFACDMDKTRINKISRRNNLPKLPNHNFLIYKNDKLEKNIYTHVNKEEIPEDTEKAKEIRKDKSTYSREALNEYNKKFTSFNKTFDTYNKKFDIYNQKFEMFSKKFENKSSDMSDNKHYDKIDEIHDSVKNGQSIDDYSQLYEYVQDHINKHNEQTEQRTKMKDSEFYLTEEDNRRQSYVNRLGMDYENDRKNEKDSEVNESHEINEYALNKRKRKNIFENEIIGNRSSITESNPNSSLGGNKIDLLDRMNKKNKKKENIIHSNLSYENSECSKGILFQSINETTNSSNTVTSKRRNYVSKESNASTFSEIPNFFHFLNSASVILGAEIIYVTDETHGKCENILKEKPLLHTTLETGFYEHMKDGLSNFIHGEMCNGNSAIGIPTDENISEGKYEVTKVENGPSISSNLMLSSNSCSRHFLGSFKNSSEAMNVECTGWLTKRRIKKYFDFCVVKLSGPTLIKGIDIDTYNFLANYAPYVSIEGAYIEDDIMMKPSTFRKYVNHVVTEYAKRKEAFFEKQRHQKKKNSIRGMENNLFLKEKEKEKEGLSRKCSINHINSEEEVMINGITYFKRNKCFYKPVLLNNRKTMNEEYKNYLQSVRYTDELDNFKDDNKFHSYVKNGNEYRYINGELHVLVDVTKDILETYPDLCWGSSQSNDYFRKKEEQQRNKFRGDVEERDEKESKSIKLHETYSLMEEIEEGKKGGLLIYGEMRNKLTEEEKEEEENFFLLEKNEYNSNALFLDNDYSTEKKIYNDLHKTYQWVSILEDERMNPGYAKFHHNCFNINTCNKIFTHLIICLLPDGGLHRLRVYGEIKRNENDKKKLRNKIINMCEILNGSTVVFTTDEFYGRSENILFDFNSNNNNNVNSINNNGNNKTNNYSNYVMGWQTSRTIYRPLRYMENLALQNITSIFSNHHFCIIKLSHISKIKYIEINTIFYEYNFPLCISVDSCYLANIHEEDKFKQTNFFTKNMKNIEWKTLIPLSYVKGNHINYYPIENKLEKTSSLELVSSHLRLNIFPDGGINTFKAFGIIV